MPWQPENWLSFPRGEGAGPPVRMYQRGNYWTDLREIWYWELV